jgi:hypothetical protein
MTESRINRRRGDCMIDHGKEWLHGRCFVSRYGKAELCQLPKEKTDRMTSTIWV